ncbi:MAG: serine hydrolase, partial [Bacillota bacterium]|nr:serine hydrolase [Bacillota bacterium]
MFKRIYIYLSIVILTLSVMNLSVKAEGGVPVPSADGAVLMNGITGDILYEKNADAAFPPASTTKILTTLITLEKCNLDDIVTVGEKPPYADGSSIALLLGEQASVRDLLYGLNLQSGNDCAEALAEHISGTQEKFAQLMNERARELG